MDKYVGLVKWAARRWGRRGHPILDPYDLEQEGWEAICRAWTRYQHLAFPDRDRLIKRSLYNQMVEAVRTAGFGITVDLSAAWEQLEYWDVETLFFGLALADLRAMLSDETWGILESVYIDQESRFPRTVVRQSVREARLALALLHRESF